ncbi:MAG: hypothetical protein Q4D85_07035 [Corynebacterium sp.]|uniref:hypothetical protein n=1 Tax=Corynebacterium sp. TaxID=1720 RepID=UPI0026DC2DA1|nr:hypothetical protein [Corynebacterium sp.]MDO5098500.1 hypothetical protein [Corynebacterium sp.]
MRSRWEELFQMDCELAALGWKDATVERAAVLPLGSEEFRQKVASIMYFRDDCPDGFLSDDHNVLFIYGLRSGKEQSLLRYRRYDGPPEIVKGIVSRCDPLHIERFVLNSRYGHGDFSLPFSNADIAAIMLVSDPDLGLEIPRSQEYLHGWVSVAAKVIANLDRIGNPDNLTLPTREELMPRLQEHIAVVLEQNFPLWEALGYLLIHMSNAGLFDRSRLIELFLNSIEHAPRVFPRRIIVQLLKDYLAVTDAELYQHRAKLIPYLKQADLFYIKSFGRWLIPMLDDCELTAVSAGALRVKNVKRQREILQTLLDRAVPPREVPQELTTIIRSLAESPDSEVAKRAKNLSHEWFG